MPTDIGKYYSPTWRGKYPHMLREDYDLWNRFLDKYAPEILKVYYDVRVGQGGAIAQGETDKWTEMYRAVTAKRIDALVEFENEVWLVEVATSPGLRAVGQLATYLTLYALDPKIPKPTIPILVCSDLDPDLLTALNLYSMRAITI